MVYVFCGNKFIIIEEGLLIEFFKIGNIIIGFDIEEVDIIVSDLFYKIVIVNINGRKVIIKNFFNNIFKKFFSEIVIKLWELVNNIVLNFYVIVFNNIFN